MKGANTLGLENHTEPVCVRSMRSLSLSEPRHLAFAQQAQSRWAAVTTLITVGSVGTHTDTHGVLLVLLYAWRRVFEYSRPSEMVTSTKYFFFFG